MALSVMAVSCGKSSDDDDTVAATPAATPTPAATAAKVEGAYEVVKTVDAALSSSASTVPGSLIIPPTSLALAKMGGNKICSEHGTPVKAGLGKAKDEELGSNYELATSDAEYASKLFYCIASMETTSPETIRGSLAQFKSVLCSFEKALGKAIEYTEAGNNLIGASGSLDVNLTTECWPQGTPEGLTKVAMTKGVATKLAADTGYQYQLSFSSEESGDYNLRFYNADGRIGFKKFGEGAKEGAGDLTEILLDTNTGSIIANIVDDREGSGGANEAYRRVVRMKVKGEFDAATLAFKAIDSMQGIYFNSGDYSKSQDSFSATTINGDKTKGFYAHSVKGTVGATPTDDYKACTGLKTDCSATGLIVDAAATKFFNYRSEWKVQKSTGLPPCDKGVDIDFGAVVPTGKLGKCE